MSEKKDFLQIESEILRVVKSIYDPEIPVNIYDLGLIYKVDVDGENKVKIEMTLTSPNCPVAESLPTEVKERVSLIKGVKSVDVMLVFDPPWDKDMMSEEAQLELGFL
ncbi:MAG: SUF system Fe-S cluster assembly protein [Chlorobi bacterium]|nr:SUF system Fe-S cluster assembly protein [Chlorobiota bacterium]